MARKKSRFQRMADIKPMTLGLMGLTALWGFFQWRDPTPPPILDQILVGGFSVWFANEAIDKKKEVDRDEKAAEAAKKHDDDDDDDAKAKDGAT